jgi:hypothetical protein
MLVRVMVIYITIHHFGSWYVGQQYDCCTNEMDNRLLQTHTIKSRIFLSKGTKAVRGSRKREQKNTVHTY